MEAEYYEASPSNPISVEVEYVYFLPTLSRIRDSGYPSTFWSIVKSLVLKTLFYVGVFICYIRQIKGDLISLLSGSFNSKGIGFSWIYQILSLFSDFILIIISLGVFSIPLLFLKGAWSLLGLLLFAQGLVLSYFLTKRMENDTVSGVLYGVVILMILLISPSITAMLVEYLETDSPVAKFLLVASQLTILKWIAELILIKIGYDISYPIIEWIEEKLVR